jgi:hypothetical protein
LPSLRSQWLEGLDCSGLKLLTDGSSEHPDTVSNWIAYEHDDTGWATASYLVVVAATSGDARRLMGEAIAVRSATASREMNIRIWAIFIEAPTELADDDPRARDIADPIQTIFHGFDGSGRMAVPRPNDQ